MNCEATNNGRNTPLQKWREEIMRNIVSVLNSKWSNHPDSHFQINLVLEAIYINQTRSPWPGSLLSKEKKELWKEFILKNSYLLDFVDSETAILEFSSRITNRLLREISTAQIAATLVSKKDEQRAQLEQLVKQECKLKSSPQDAVSRSVQRYLKGNANKRKKTTEIRCGNDEKIRDLLGLPRIGRSVIPSEDIRVHMARYLKNSNHIDILSSLNERDIESKIGKEFSKYCRLIGFADGKKRILLVEVSSSTAAQEVAFNKMLFISRLRKMPGFESIVDIKFQIQPTKRTH